MTSWKRIVVGCLLAAWGCSEPEARRVTRTGELAAFRGEFVTQEVLTGRLAAVSSIPLVVPRTRSWNVVIQTLAENGARLRKGDPVVELDNSQAASTLEDLRLAAQRATGEVERQRAANRVDLATREYEVKRQTFLVEQAEIDAGIPPDLIPRRTHEEHQLALEKARLALAKANDELAAARRTAALELEVREIALEKAQRQVSAAEDEVAAMVLRAPRDGIVIVGEHPWMGRPIEAGDNVWPGVRVVEFPDLTEMRVEAVLSDVDDGRVTPGMKARCVLDAHPRREHDCVVRDVAPFADELRRGSLRRGFTVLLDLDETDPVHMRPGMSVRVEITTDTRAGALMAPRQAIDLAATPPRALLADGTAVPVELGPCNHQECVIESGLEEGALLLATREPAP